MSRDQIQADWPEPGPEDVWCKASALAALALARNTYVSAINLQQCSAADLNPYNIGVYEEIILNLKFKK